MKRTTLLIVILTLFGSSPLWSQDSDQSLQEYVHGTTIPEGQFNPLVPDVYSMTPIKAEAPICTQAPLRIQLIYTIILTGISTFL